MTLNEIRESGLIELYALDLLSDEQRLQVEGFLSQYPELKDEFNAIQRTLELIAKEHGIEPRSELKDEIIDSVSSKKSGTTSATVNAKKQFPWWSIILLVGLASLMFYAWKSYNDNNQLQSQLDRIKYECDSLTSVQAERLTLLEAITDPSNRIIQMTPTEGYPATKLIFNINDARKTNLIQIQGLPPIASNQAYQLWSLKEGVDPIPLTVFNGSIGEIIPVAHEAGTATYAITIEEASGVKVPTLTRLIGTVPNA